MRRESHAPFCERLAAKSRRPTLQLIGNYHNAGQQWRVKKQPHKVQGHDFPSPDVPRAYPYGIYDIGRNTGFVNIGTDHDTGAFAVASIRGWWRREGRRLYPRGKALLITADGGGSNGWRLRLWKVELQKFADESGLKNGCSQLALEICDGFWPYQKQPPRGSRPEPEAEFVQKVRGLFLAPACVQASFSGADEKIAAGLHRRGVSLEQITRAILLGCARKYVAMINAGVRTPITSLQYFSDIVEEVSESAIPESYWEPLRSKVARMEQQWQKIHPART